MKTIVIAFAMRVCDNADPEFIKTVMQAKFRELGFRPHVIDSVEVLPPERLLPFSDN